MKKILFLLLFLIAIPSFSQDAGLGGQGKEISRQRGRFFVDGKQISTRETKQLLAANEEAYALFKKGKAKESTGGILIAVGGGCLVADLVKGLVSDEDYPTALTYIGAAALVVSIPVLIGKNKKVDEGLATYNKGLKKTLGYQPTNYQLNVTASAKGCGLQLKF